MYYEINGNILPQVRLVGKAILEPPYVHRKRQADEFILYVMKQGELYLKEDQTEYCLKKGDVLLLDPDFVHQGLQSSSCEYYYVHFHHGQLERKKRDDQFACRCSHRRSESLKEDNGSYLRYQDSWILFPKMLSMNPDAPAYFRVLSLMEQAMEHNCCQLENYKVLCGMKLLEAMVEIAREGVTASALTGGATRPASFQKVQQLTGYLNSNYHRPISSSLIEQEFSCNFDYLNRVFKRSRGKTIFAYLNEIRIQHARELMASTSMKVAAIGRRVGFEDECYFSKVFKKYTGVSPSQYEKMSIRTDQGQWKPG